MYSLNDHHSYECNLAVAEIKPEKKNTGLNGISTHELCDTSAVLYRLTGSWSDYISAPGSPEMW